MEDWEKINEHVEALVGLLENSPTSLVSDYESKDDLIRRGSWNLLYLALYQFKENNF